MKIAPPKKHNKKLVSNTLDPQNYHILIKKDFFSQPKGYTKIFPNFELQAKNQ